MSPLRISGLASGMDIDSMVTNLMKAERMPLDKLKQKQQVLEWQRDDYRSMNTLLLDFRTQLTNMKLTTMYRARTVSSSNEAMVSATASSAASKAAYTISDVTQLASAASKVSASAISGSTKVDQSKALYDEKDHFANSWTWHEGSIESKSIIPPTETNTFSLDFKNGEKITDFDSIKVMVDGISYQVVSGTPTSDKQVSVDTNGNLSFQNNIKKTSTIKVDYATDKKVESITAPDDSNTIQLAKGSIKNVSSLVIDGTNYTVDSIGKISLVSDPNTPVGNLNLKTGILTMDSTHPIGKGKGIDIQYTQNYFNFNLTTSTSKGTISENFAIQGSETMNTLINKVNASTVGVTMFYDEMKDKFSLTRNETGNFNGKDSLDPAHSSADDEILTQVSSTSGNFLDSALQLGGVTELGGDNAKFIINGLSTERYSNTFQMSGVTYTIKQKFSSPVSISVGNDSTKVYDNIKAFVDKYNELVSTIQKKVSEDYYRDYPPLTDDQKEQLSDKQQEQWTEKAKSGLLRRDSTLTGVLDGMRANFYAPVKNSQVNPVYSQLASIGITTTANYLEGGKLEINEAKLKAAIEADPDSVENLFRGSGSTSSEQGVIQRLYDTVNHTMDSLKSKAGNSFSTNKQFSLGLQLDSVTSQIKSFEDRMTQVEDRYYRQFTAMEKAIQKANSQSTYMMQQFGGGQ
jgi:flagellar hook-associated protein 2